MKKYLFGLFAIVMATALSAFSAPSLATADFVFKGDVCLQSDVENPAMWGETTGESCPDGDEQACRINNVDDAYWFTDMEGEKHLNTSGTVLDIDAAGFFSGFPTYYVASVSDISAVIDNTSRP